MDDLGAIGVPDLAGANLENLYQAQYASLVRLAGLLLGDYLAGEEIAQDAFARLVEASRRVTSPPAYLRATVVNLCRSRIRRAVVARRHRAIQLADPPTGDDGPERVASHMAIAQELAKLPRRQREAVVLRYYADLSEPEIADAMGVSTGSVKTHLHRAMAALAEQMEALR
jgi:RNA polymerase sigma-70 factor (sigma-E family)